MSSNYPPGVTGNEPQIVGDAETEAKAEITVDLAQDTIDAIDDLMGEATRKRPVQNWGRVNDVLVRMQVIVNEDQDHED